MIGAPVRRARVLETGRRARALLSLVSLLGAGPLCSLPAGAQPATTPATAPASGARVAPDTPPATAPAPQAPVRAQVAPVSAFDDAVNAFKYQDFDNAIKHLRALLYPRSVLDRKREWRAREYLGASLWWSDAKQASLDEFTALLVRNPQAKLDPTFYPPQIIRDFEQLRVNLVRLGVIRPDQKPAPPDLGEEEARAPYALTWVPFGVGQIANNEPVKGIALMVVEAALAGTSYAFFELNHADGIRGTQSTSRQIWQLSTGVGFWLVAAWGVVDAVLERGAQDRRLSGGASDR